MNKQLKRIAIAALACVMMNGVAMAAPARHYRHVEPVRHHQKAPPPKHHVVRHVHHCNDGVVAFGAAAIGVAALVGIVNAICN